MKMINVNGIDYIIHKNPNGGWDLRFEDISIVGYSIKDIKNIINENTKAI